MSRELRIALVANTASGGGPLHTQLRSFQSYSRRRRLPMEIVAYTPGAADMDSRMRQTPTVADLVGDCFFARADVVLYSFGNRFDLFDSIHFVSRRSSAWVVYAGPPGTGDSAAVDRTGFYRQCVNLLLANGVFALDPRGQGEVESFGIDPSRSFLCHTADGRLDDTDLELILERAPALTPEIASLVDEDRAELLRCLNIYRDDKPIWDARITRTLCRGPDSAGTLSHPGISPADTHVDTHALPSRLYLLLPAIDDDFHRLATHTAHACARAAADSNIDCRIIVRMPASEALPAMSDRDVVVVMCGDADQSSEVALLRRKRIRCGRVAWADSCSTVTFPTARWDFVIGAGRALTGHLQLSGEITRAFIPGTELELVKEEWVAPRNTVVELALRHGQRHLYVLPVSEHLSDAALVLDAFTDLWRRGRDLVLVVAALNGRACDPALAIFSNHPENGRRLHILSNLDSSSKELIYESAAAIICPDRRWAYDLELHHTLSRGCTVIASRTPCHREMAPNAIFFEARSACALASMVDELDERVQRTAAIDPTFTPQGPTLKRSGFQLLDAIAQCISEIRRTGGEVAAEDGSVRGENTSGRSTQSKNGEQYNGSNTRV